MFSFCSVPRSRRRISVRLGRHSSSADSLHLNVGKEGRKVGEWEGGNTAGIAFSFAYILDRYPFYSPDSRAALCKLGWKEEPRNGTW